MPRCPFCHRGFCLEPYTVKYKTCLGPRASVLVGFFRSFPSNSEARACGGATDASNVNRCSSFEFIWNCLSPCKIATCTVILCATANTGRGQREKKQTLNWIHRQVVYKSRHSVKKVQQTTRQCVLERFPKRNHVAEQISNVAQNIIFLVKLLLCLLYK